MPHSSAFDEWPLLRLTTDQEQRLNAVPDASLRGAADALDAGAPRPDASLRGAVEQRLYDKLREMASDLGMAVPQGEREEEEEEEERSGDGGGGGRAARRSATCTGPDCYLCQHRQVATRACGNDTASIQRLTDGFDKLHRMLRDEALVREPLARAKAAAEWWRKHMVGVVPNAHPIDASQLYRYMNECDCSRESVLPEMVRNTRRRIKVLDALVCEEQDNRALVLQACRVISTLQRDLLAIYERV